VDSEELGPRLEDVVRSLRHEHPGAVYHVTSRGNARGAIFLDSRDEERFFETLGRVVSDTGWICHAYCLMPNHFHLLLETPRPNLARGMQRLNSTFAQTFNKRHARVGHVLQGRYHAVLIEKESHLLEVCRYVVLNPVRARLCTSPAAWPSSSYRASAGLSPRPSFLTVEWLLDQFGAGRRAFERYRAFVADGIDRRPLADVRGQIYLGSEEFARALSAPHERIEEIPRAQWQPVRHRLDELVHDGDGQGIALAFREGYTLREIAGHLGVHVATVSRRLRRLAA
jgi:putative transposase